MSAGRGASMEFVTNSPEETEELGERLALELQERYREEWGCEG